MSKVAIAIGTSAIVLLALIAWALVHGAVLGRAVERGEIDPHTAYNFTLARLLRMPTDDLRKVDEYAAGRNELRKWLDGDPDGE